MRCTKCHYLSFDPEPRCRNCGHDLSLDALDALDGLSLGDPEPEDALADFRLDRGVASADGQPGLRTGEAGAAVATLSRPVTAPHTTELPLFVRDIIEGQAGDDLPPLVKMPAQPRQPLAVRRPTPDPSRLRARYTPATSGPSLLDEDEDEVGDGPTPMWRLPEPEPVDVTATAASRSARVSAGTRLGAAVIDASVLGAIAATTVAFTLRIVELPAASVLALPMIPLGAFLLLIGVGYELMFTAANGQTIGKMLMGIRVVSNERGIGTERVSMRQATLRAVSMVPLGAGLLTAFGGHGLAVHDRVAHTRVVRA